MFYSQGISPSFKSSKRTVSTAVGRSVSLPRRRSWRKGMSWQCLKYTKKVESRWWWVVMACTCGKIQVSKLRAMCPISSSCRVQTYDTWHGSHGCNVVELDLCPCWWCLHPTHIDVGHPFEDFAHLASTPHPQLKDMRTSTTTWNQHSQPKKATVTLWNKLELYVYKAKKTELESNYFPEAPEVPGPKLD